MAAPIRTSVFLPAASILSLSLYMTLLSLAFDRAAGAAVDHEAVRLRYGDVDQHPPGGHGNGQLDGLFDAWLTRFTQARLRGAGAGVGAAGVTYPNGEELARFYDVDAVLIWYDHGDDAINATNRTFSGAVEIGQSYAELFSRLAAGPDLRMRDLQHSVDVFAPGDGAAWGGSFLTYFQLLPPHTRRGTCST